MDMNNVLHHLIAVTLSNPSPEGMSQFEFMLLMMFPITVLFLMCWVIYRLVNDCCK